MHKLQTQKWLFHAKNTNIAVLLIPVALHRADFMFQLLLSRHMDAHSHPRVFHS